MQQVAAPVELLFVEKDHKVEVKATLGEDSLDLLVGPLPEREAHQPAEGGAGWASDEPGRLLVSDEL